MLVLTLKIGGEIQNRSAIMVGRAASAECKSHVPRDSIKATIILRLEFVRQNIYPSIDYIYEFEA
jgi:hypothetical protein